VPDEDERLLRIARRHPPPPLQAATQQNLTGSLASGLPFDADRGKSTRAGRQPARGRQPAGVAPAAADRNDYFRCALTSLVISNMETCFLPPKTAFSFSSALIIRLLMASCSLFFLM
jgi:hypothetical protein